jgi:lipopolysaccharide transport system permease protein
MTTAQPEVTSTTIQPPDRWPILGFGELWQTRRILWVLAQRVIKVRYQQTVLGILWVVLQPLLLTIIISVFMGLILDRGQRLDLPFAVFLFPAWVVWRTFSKDISEGGNSVLANGALVQRIYLPRLYFPLSIILASLVDLFFMTMALLVLLIVYGVAPGIGLLALPFALLIMYAAAIGVALFFAATSVQYRDMDILVPLMVQAWFWSSPIIYPTQLIPEWIRTFYYLNPLAVVIDTFRWAFTQTPAPPLEAWFLGSSVAAIMLVVGFVFFRRREPLFADWMGE